MEQTLDFPGGEAFAAAAIEGNFHLKPVLARAAHGDLRGDDFNLLADVGEARADRDLPARELLQAGHSEREESQNGVLTAQKVVAGGVGAGEAPAGEAFAGGAFGENVACVKMAGLCVRRRVGEGFALRRDADADDALVGVRRLEARAELVERAFDGNGELRLPGFDAGERGDNVWRG